MKKLTMIIAAATLAAGLSTPTWAHPKLTASAPAADASVGATKQITLTFSERLMPKLSGIDLAMTGMPGMASHAPMKISGFKTEVAPDGKTIVATFAKPLAAGTYKLDWHVVSADTHRVTGSLGFAIK